MIRERSLGWVVLTAVLVAPVVLYQYAPQREEPPTPGIRPDLVQKKDKFPAPRTDDQKILPAPEPSQPAVEPTPAANEPPPSLEPPYSEPAPAAEEPAAAPLQRDPTLSPSDVLRLVGMKDAASVPDYVPPPPSHHPSIESQVQVQAIIKLETGVVQAIINDERVSEGDTVKRAKVLSIKEDSVTFSYHGRTFQKKLGD
jgi:hypothetical protein